MVPDFPTVVLNECSSTMDEAKLFVSNNFVFTPTCVVARTQTQGRGRGGSIWVQSDQKCLAKPLSENQKEVEQMRFHRLGDALQDEVDFLPLTFIWPTSCLKIPMSWISLAVGCALHDAVSRFIEFAKDRYFQLPYREHILPYFLKWPNDLITLEEGKKLGGILCESSFLGGVCQEIYIGIGFNFFSHPALPHSQSLLEILFSSDKIPKILDHWDKQNSRGLLLSFFSTALCEELYEYLAFYRDVSQLKALALARSVPLGTLLCVEKSQHCGAFTGLDDHGGLLLEGLSKSLLSAQVQLSKARYEKKAVAPKELHVPIVKNLKLQKKENGFALSHKHLSLVKLKRQNSPIPLVETIHPSEESPRPSHALISSMLKARMSGRLENPQAPRLENFRRIGGRIENSLQERLDTHLSHRFKFHCREDWYHRVALGEVMIERNSPKEPQRGHQPILIKVKPTYRMKNYDQIWLFHPPEYEPTSLFEIDVVYDNGDICIFSKPPNLVIHAAGLYLKNTFIEVIRKMGFGDCAPVHRIDRETSGLLVCARQTPTRRKLSEAFRSSQVRKFYLAVSKGTRALPERFRVDLPIGEPQESSIRIKMWVGGNHAQPATTNFVRLAQHGHYSLFACFPVTGRTNQIRVHLAALGHWIVGDKMYHKDEQVFIDFYEKGLTADVLRNVEFPRHMLHNTGVIFNPEAQIDSLQSSPVVTPFPSDMLEFPVIKELLKNAQIPLEKEEQMRALQEIFLNLRAWDFSQEPSLEV